MQSENQVIDYLLKAKKSPTLKQIAYDLDFSHVNEVYKALRSLSKKGYISKEPNKRRSIKVLKSPTCCKNCGHLI